MSSSKDRPVRGRPRSEVERRPNGLEVERDEVEPDAGAATSDHGLTQDRRAEEVARLELRVAELEAELAESSPKYLRLAADFDNFRRRSRQEQGDLMQHANGELINALLPIVDNLDRALAETVHRSDDALAQGVRMIQRQLDEILLSQGLERVESVGASFDPTVHEAVSQVETADAPEDTVVAEIRPGYRLHQKILRPALVAVARPPAPPN